MAKPKPRRRLVTPVGILLGLAVGTAMACLFQHPVVGFLGGAAMGLVLGSAWSR
jgi:hypothetical protein